MQSVIDITGVPKMHAVVVKLDDTDLHARLMLRTENGCDPIVSLSMPIARAEALAEAINEAERITALPPIRAIRAYVPDDWSTYGDGLPADERASRDPNDEHRTYGKRELV